MAPIPSIVRRNSGQFAADNSDRFSAWRQLPAHQLLHRERIRDVVRDRREIVESVRVGDKLVVLHVLGDLFIPAMQVADVRRSLRDNLPIQFQNDAQDAVG